VISARQSLLVFSGMWRIIPGSGLGMGAMMDLFLGEKVAVLESETTHKTCRSCGERLKLVRTMVASGTGSIVHMFECRCGQRTWDD
jgi:hypothetical protein